MLKMNFLSEVINIVSENEIADARTTLKKLLREIRNFQDEAQSHVQENYVEFTDSMENNGIYIEQAEHLAKEVDDLVQNIESDTRNDLMMLSEDVQQYLTELRELTIGLRLNKRILKIDELFVRLEEVKDNCRQRQSILNEMRELITDEEDEDIFKRTECYKNIKIRWQLETQMLLNTLQTQFDHLVQIKERTFQSTKSSTIKVTKNRDALQEIVQMLYQSNFNTKRLCTFLLNNIFEPIITKPVSLEVIEKKEPSSLEDRLEEDFSTLTLSFSTRPLVTADDLNLRPNYKTVFQQITQAFEHLCHLNVLLAPERSFFDVFADAFGADLIRLIINECLSHAIPETIDGMGSSTLVSDILEFDAFLKKIEFKFDEQTKEKLIDFSERVEIIFKKRFCLNIVKKAVEFMHKDLHDMQVIEEIKPGHKFARCMVSRSTFEIIQLMEQVLKEANEVEQSEPKSVDTYVIDDIQERLRSTIPMILERYVTAVPEKHEKMLVTFPQQTALFHNNCLYLAWWLSKTQTSTSIQFERCSSIVVELQELGQKYFSCQIQNQHKQLFEILKEFDLSESITELGTQPLRIIRQCLRQLDLLKNVWQTILSEEAYSKTMGTLVNDFCDEIIKNIVCLEDISSAVAEGLVNIIETIIEKVPAIFTDPVEVTVYVKKWTKLEQLKMILNATMAQILEQWADGKGPLTLNFKAEDIRHLIRALFQNTDRRARALAAIN